LRRHGDSVRQHFDGHHSFETDVLRPIHFAHPTDAEQRDNLVRAEPCAGDEGQTVVDYMRRTAVLDG
jgi:hypothetical protein